MWNEDGVQYLTKCAETLPRFAVGSVAETSNETHSVHIIFVRYSIYRSFFA